MRMHRPFGQIAQKLYLRKACEIGLCSNSIAVTFKFLSQPIDCLSVRLIIRRLCGPQPLKRISPEIVRRSLGGRRRKSPFAAAKQAPQNVRALHYDEGGLIAFGAASRSVAYLSRG